MRAKASCRGCTTLSVFCLHLLFLFHLTVFLIMLVIYTPMYMFEESTVCYMCCLNATALIHLNLCTLWATKCFMTAQCKYRAETSGMLNEFCMYRFW